MVATTKAPCPDCGSKDNLAIYEDGHEHCFTPGCKRHTNASGEQVDTAGEDQVLTYAPLRKRRLTEETCRLFRYGLVDFKGYKVQAAQAFDAKGKPVGMKLRLPGKKFIWQGNSKAAALFGQHLFAPGGRMITVTEGEIDAMSLSQCKDNRYPVVSIMGGAQSGYKELKRQLEYLESFETVVLMFDSDEPGQEAAKQCAELFSPGKCKIANLPLKDANEMLVAGRVEELTLAVWRAREYRPDGIASDEDVWEALVAEDTSTWVPYPWPGLEDALRGQRTGELITVVAGTGVGKSLFCKELAHHLITSGHRVGYIALEEAVKRTALGLLSITLGKPLHLMRPEELSQVDLKPAFEATVAGGKCVFYDHFGSLEVDRLLSKVRYMIKSLDCAFIVLDHISIVVSGLEIEDERKAIDVTMTKLRSLVQETGAGVLAVCHLRRVSGTAHEEGGSVSLSHVRGSQSVAQLSDVVIGLERNQQDEEAKDMTTVRVLKDRFGGYSGIACTLAYDKATGRLSEVAREFGTEDSTKGDF